MTCIGNAKEHMRTHIRTRFFVLLYVTSVMTNGRRLKLVALTKSKPCAIFIDWLPNDTWIGFVIRFPTMYQRRESLCVCVCEHVCTWRSAFPKIIQFFYQAFYSVPFPLLPLTHFSFMHFAGTSRYAFPCPNFRTPDFFAVFDLTWTHAFSTSITNDIGIAATIVQFTQTHHVFRCVSIAFWCTSTHTHEYISVANNSIKTIFNAFQRKLFTHSAVSDRDS